MYICCHSCRMLWHFLCHVIQLWRRLIPQTSDVNGFGELLLFTECSSYSVYCPGWEASAKFTCFALHHVNHLRRCWQLMCLPLHVCVLCASLILSLGNNHCRMQHGYYVSELPLTFQASISSCAWIVMHSLWCRKTETSSSHSWRIFMFLACLLWRHVYTLNRHCQLQSICLALMWLSFSIIAKANFPVQTWRYLRNCSVCIQQPIRNQIDRTSAVPNLQAQCFQLESATSMRKRLVHKATVRVSCD